MLPNTTPPKKKNKFCCELHNCIVSIINFCFLFAVNAEPVAEWKRISELSDNPALFVDGVEPGDVIQGSLGDCWFLGPLSGTFFSRCLRLPLLACKALSIDFICLPSSMQSLRTRLSC